MGRMIKMLFYLKSALRHFIPSLVLPGLLFPMALSFIFYPGVAKAAVWELSEASYDSVSFSIAGQETIPGQVEFKSDGTKMYVVGAGSDAVFQYSLSTAWNVSTASYDSVSFSILAQDGTSQDISFKPDGTKMYMTGSASDTVYQYSLSTAWNVSTASYDSVSLAAGDTVPTGIAFKPDGTKLYIIGQGSDAVRQYSLSSAWDLSTATFDSITFSVATQETVPNAVGFKPDGTKMFIVGVNSDAVFQYSLSTAWNVSTASYDSVSFSVGSQETNTFGMTFKTDGSKMYIIGNTNDTVYQYTLGVAPPTCTLSASPTMIAPGGSSTLTWTSTNATSTTIDNGVGSVTPTTTGSTSVSPTVATTYTMTVTGNNQVGQCSATVTPYHTPRIVRLKGGVRFVTRAATTTAVSVATTTVFLTTTGAGTWTVPADWSNNNIIHVVGGGGGGDNNSITGPGGGGGGAYGAIKNISLSVGASVQYSIGTGGSGGTTPQSGANTWFNASSYAACTSNCVKAAGGSGANDATGGAGGLVGGIAGNVEFAGGAGGNGTDIGDDSSGGAGGAGGPNGVGGAGGGGDTATAGDEASGGGGASGDDTGTTDNGTQGAADGGAGGDSYQDPDSGGAGGVAGNGTAGVRGGGGGGGDGDITSRSGGDGGSGVTWEQTSNDALAGPGGGGGGGNDDGGSGGNGGLYGGGGGGGSTSGAGAQGIIVIQYRPTEAAYNSLPGGIRLR